MCRQRKICIWLKQSREIKHVLVTFVLGINWPVMKMWWSNSYLIIISQLRLKIPENSNLNNKHISLMDTLIHTHHFVLNYSNSWIKICSLLALAFFIFSCLYILIYFNHSTPSLSHVPNISSSSCHLLKRKNLAVGLFVTQGVTLRYWLPRHRLQMQLLLVRCIWPL